MAFPEAWLQIVANASAVEGLLRPLARSTLAHRQCSEIAARAKKAALCDRGSTKVLVVVFDESPALSGWYPLFEWSPPQDGSSQQPFALPEDYEAFSRRTDQLMVDYATELPSGDLATGVTTHNAVEFIFGEHAAADATDNMLSEDYLGQVLSAPEDFGWTNEHLALNQPGEFLAVGDDSNSNFYVLHRGVSNAAGEPAVLPWAHDEPGGYEDRFVAFAPKQTGFGDWLIGYLHCKVLGGDFYEAISESE